MAFKKSHGWCAAIATAMVVCLAASADAGNFLIENVTVIDGTGSAPLPGASVLIKGDRIVAVSPEPLKHESGVEVIDGRGKFLIPGLIDTHIHLQGNIFHDGKPAFDNHLGITALHSYLYDGVTSIFDAGNEPDYIFPMREQERTGKIVSPRIFATGLTMTVPGGYGDGGTHAFTIRNWTEARPQIDAYQKQRKPDLQKVLIDRHGVFVPLNPVPSIDLLQKLVALSNSNGVRTTVHAASEEDYNDALEGGIDNFAHIIRFPATDALLKRISTRRIVISSTLAVFEFIGQLETDPSFLDTPFFKAAVWPDILNALKTTERANFIKTGTPTQSRFFAPNVARNAKKIFDNGGLIAAGTDRTWGPALHMDLDYLHRAGIPLLDIVRIGTLNGAMYLGKEKDLGSIERGKLADLVLLNADPTQDVKNFQAIAAVFKGGQRIDRTALEVPANGDKGAAGKNAGVKKKR